MFPCVLHPRTCGRRASRHRQIHPVLTRRRVNLKYNTHQSERERPRVLSAIPKAPVTPNTSAPSFLPRLFLTNACSVLNKIDELAETLQQARSDITIVTESWVKPTTTPDQYNVANFNVFSKRRQDRPGGGILIYTNDNLRAEPIEEIIVPPELEATWMLVTHPKLPRAVPYMYIAVAAVYIPPQSPHQDLMNHLISSVDYLLTHKAQAGIMIMGDFNRTEIKSLVWEMD